MKLEVEKYYIARNSNIYKITKNIGIFDNYPYTGKRISLEDGSEETSGQTWAENGMFGVNPTELDLISELDEVAKLLFT